MKAELIWRAVKRSRTDLVEFECNVELVKRFDKFLHDPAIQRLMKDTDVLKDHMKAHRKQFTTEAVEEWRQKMRQGRTNILKEPMYDREEKEDKERKIKPMISVKSNKSNGSSVMTSVKSFIPQLFIPHNMRPLMGVSSSSKVTRQPSSRDTDTKTVVPAKSDNLPVEYEKYTVTKLVPTSCKLMTFTLQQHDETNAMVKFKCNYRYRNSFTDKMYCSHAEIPLSILVQEDIFGGDFWPYYTKTRDGKIDDPRKCINKKLAITAPAEQLEWDYIMTRSSSVMNGFFFPHTAAGSYTNNSTPPATALTTIQEPSCSMDSTAFVEDCKQPVVTTPRAGGVRRPPVRFQTLYPSSFLKSLKGVTWNRYLFIPEEGAIIGIKTQRFDF